MTGKVWNLAPQAGAIRSKKNLHLYWSPYWQKWIARSWPKARGKGTANQQAANAFFSDVVSEIKNAVSEDVIAAQQMAEHTPLLARDILMKCYTGTMFTIRMADGTIFESWRLCVEDIQNGLNTLTTAVGAIIFRAAGQWSALLKGDDGTILALDSTTGLPAWKNAVAILGAAMQGEDGVTVDSSGSPLLISLSPVAPGNILANVASGDASPSPTSLSDLLDFISDVEGGVLYRSDTGWQVLAPGDPGDVLTLDAITGLPAWEAGGGGGGGATCIDLYSPPVSTSFTTFTGDSVSPVLSDVTDLGMVLDSGATTGSTLLRGCVEAVPGSDYTLTARIRVTKTPYRYREGGLCISDGTKFIMFGFGSASGDGDFLAVARFTNKSTFSSNQQNLAIVEHMEYLQIKNDGAHRIYSVSRDGRNWSEFWREGHADYLTETTCGFATQPTANDTTVTGDHMFLTVPFWGATSP